MKTLKRIEKEDQERKIEENRLETLRLRRKIKRDRIEMKKMEVEIKRNGKIYKQRIQSGLKKIDGVYVVTKVVMNNLGTSRISQMDKTAMRHNVQVDPEFLSQRALTDFAFRERNLEKFRADIQH